MQPPLVLSENGDVLLFASREEAEAYLEPIDVQNQEYRGYDAAGRLLAFQVTTEEVPILLGLFKVSRERVRVEVAERLPSHQAEVQSILAGALLRMGIAEDRVRRAELAQLVAIALEVLGTR